MGRTQSAEWTQVSSVKKAKKKQRASQRAGERASEKNDTAHSSPGWADRTFFQKQDVGIDDDIDFRVVRRLLGPSGENLKHITDEVQGAKVWISGKGARLTEKGQDQESGPLRICIRTTSQSTLCEASALVRDLLQSIHEDYKRYWSRRGCPPGSAVASCDSTLACTFKVGIEEDTAFQVVKRLLGKSGKNMKRIETESGGAWVRISGRRNLKQDKSEGPLEMQVSATTQTSFDAAVALVMALLTRVHADYREFCALNGQPAPSLPVVGEPDHSF